MRLGATRVSVNAAWVLTPILSPSRMTSYRGCCAPIRGWRQASATSSGRNAVTRGLEAVFGRVAAPGWRPPRSAANASRRVESLFRPVHERLRGLAGVEVLVSGGLRRGDAVEGCTYNTKPIERELALA